MSKEERKEQTSIVVVHYFFQPRPPEDNSRDFLEFHISTISLLAEPMTIILISKFTHQFCNQYAILSPDIGH